MRSVQILSLSLSLALALLVSATARAGSEELNRDPEGPVILVVSGEIEVAPHEGALRLDRQMMESLGTREVVSTTPWTDGEIVFEGVPAQALMEAAGARGQRITAIALNDYSAEFSLSDFREFDVLLALKMNGEALRVRDKGPIWIIYPDDKSDHESREVRTKMVWQLKELRVE